MNFETRLDLPKLLVELGLTTSGVEVGVQHGDYAAHLLANWPGHLTLVDPWRHLEGYKDAANVSDEEHEAAMQKAIKQCNVAGGGRFNIVRRTSLDAARTLAESARSLAELGHKQRPFDFVYIDADHSYEAAKADIAAWLPHVRPGGIIAGHDFVPDGEYPYGSFGVKRAVLEAFAPERVVISREGGGLAPSWLVRL